MNMFTMDYYYTQYYYIHTHYCSITNSITIKHLLHYCYITITLLLQWHYCYNSHMSNIPQYCVNEWRDSQEETIDNRTNNVSN